MAFAAYGEKGVVADGANEARIGDQPVQLAAAVVLVVDQVRQNPRIVVHEFHAAVDLLTRRRLGLKGGANACGGAYVLDVESGAVQTFLARATALATGGAGKIYLYTSNPDIATGDGMAMAFRPFGNVLYGSGGPAPGPGGASTNAAFFTAPEPGMRPLGSDALLAIAMREVPHWETVTLRMGGRTGRGRPGPQQAQRREISDSDTERMPSTGMEKGSTNIPSVPAMITEGHPEYERREPTGRS